MDIITLAHTPSVRPDRTVTVERLNKEIKRRTNVVGVFPNEAAVTRLVGALMPEQIDEWAIRRRYMALEIVAAICDTTPIDPAAIAALLQRLSQGRRTKLYHVEGRYRTRLKVSVKTCAEEFGGFDLFFVTNRTFVMSL